MDGRSLDCIKELRSNIVQALKAADIDGIGQNVFSARQEKAWPEESGFICVYTPNTNFDDKRTSPRFYFASGDVYVDIYGRGSTIENNDSPEVYDVNDFLDDVSKAVVEALQPLERRVGPYSGLVKRIVVKSFSNNLSSNGETERGSQRIVFSVEYAVTIMTTGAADLFCSAKTTLSMGSGAKNKMEFETAVQDPPPAPPAPEPDEPEENTET